MTNTKTKTAKTASDILAKAVNKVDALDRDLARDLANAMAEVMARYQR